MHVSRQVACPSSLEKWCTCSTYGCQWRSWRGAYPTVLARCKVAEGASRSAIRSELMLRKGREAAWKIARRDYPRVNRRKMRLGHVDRNAPVLLRGWMWVMTAPPSVSFSAGGDRWNSLGDHLLRHPISPPRTTTKRMGVTSNSSNLPFYVRRRRSEGARPVPRETLGCHSPVDRLLREARAAQPVAQQTGWWERETERERDREREREKMFTVACHQILFLSLIRSEALLSIEVAQQRVGGRRFRGKAELNHQLKISDRLFSMNAFSGFLDDEPALQG